MIFFVVVFFFLCHFLHLLYLDFLLFHLHHDHLLQTLHLFLLHFIPVLLLLLLLLLIGLFPPMQIPSHQTSKAPSLWWAWERSGKAPWWAVYFLQSSCLADMGLEWPFLTFQPYYSTCSFVNMHVSNLTLPLFPQTPLCSSAFFVPNISLIVWGQSFSVQKKGM